MALTAQEEQRIREILALSAPLLDLGDKSAQIDQALGYSDVRVVDLPTAAPLGDTDVMYIAQQSTDVKATVNQFGQYVFDEFVEDILTPFLASKANVNSPTLTGDPKSVTPPQFDNDTSIGTTAWVRRELGNNAGSRLFASGGTSNLAASDAGKIIIVGGSASGTLILPTSGSVPEGYGFDIKSESTAQWTISGAAGDGAIIVHNRNSVSNFTLNTDEDIRIRKVGSLWRTYGTGVLRTSSLFGNLKQPNGHCILPNGIIFQWGLFVQNDTGSPLVFNFPLPIAFPNTALNAWITPGNNLVSGVSASIEGTGTVDVAGFTVGPAGQRTYRVLIVGY